MPAREMLLHATIERERGKAENLESVVREVIKDLRAEGDRLFEKHGAIEARNSWALVQRLERSLRRSEIREEFSPA